MPFNLLFSFFLFLLLTKNRHDPSTSARPTIKAWVRDSLRVSLRLCARLFLHSVAQRIDSGHSDGMPDTLDLDPEWGAIDLLEDIEDTFGIKISDDEAENCCTVGDVYNVICAHLPQWDLQDGNCGSSIIFYRIRSALRPLEKREIRPTTALSAMGQSPSRMFRTIETESGLRLPSPSMTWRGNIGVVILTAGVIFTVIAVFAALWLTAVVLGVIAAIGLAIVKTDPCRFPKGVETIGELVKRALPLNATFLVEAGGRPADRWSILTALAGEHGSLQPAAISPDTYLHRKSLQDACAA